MNNFHRLFFALWPDDSIRRALHHAVRKLQRHCGGKPVPTGNFHITLSFLGSLTDEDMETAIAVAGCIHGSAFKLQFDTSGFWPHAAVVWLAPTKPPDALLALELDLTAGLRGAGFRLDPRPYRPHLTLARKVRQPGNLPPVVTVDWQVNEFVLAESVTAARAATYQVLARWPLSVPG